MLISPDLIPADIVTLDRVICCYGDMETLVRLSSAMALKFYGLVYPRDGLCFRMVWKFWSWLDRNVLRRSPACNSYLHSGKMVDQIVRANGMKRQFVRNVGIWKVVLYRR